MNNSVILDEFAFQRNYITLLTDDIADEKMTAQPGGIVNHPAWHLGHLATAFDNFAQLLGCPRALDEAWSKKFGQQSVPSADRSAYPSKAELIRILDERRNAVVQAFAKTSSDDLAKPNPNAHAAALFPTVGVFILFGMLFHEGTHLGQLASWRKAAGMVPALSKLRR
jgi:hypothetical protein